MWLHEAIAVYESDQHKDFMPVFFNNVRKKLPGFSDLNDLQFRYIIAWSFAEFMTLRFSKLQLLELMTRVGQVKEIIGLTEKELENRWQDWLTERYISDDLNLTQPTTLAK